MKHIFVRLLCILFTFYALSGTTGDFANREISFNSPIGKDFNSFDQSPARRSLLSQSNEPSTALVATLDGTIYLSELNSMKALWSFTSGPPIYSSYQAPINHDDKENASGPESGFFIDCGDDWALYIHNRLGKLKLQEDIEMFISSAPQIQDDGTPILGSKRTTAFRVDAKTGRVIHTYRMPDSPPISHSNEEKSVIYDTTTEEQGQSGSVNGKTDDPVLHITRTDYTLTSFVQDSNKVLWNMTVAEFSVAFLCQEVENSFDGAILDSGPSGSGFHFNMPLPCQSRAKVFRFRKDMTLSLEKGTNSLTVAHHEDTRLPLSTSNHILPSQPKVDRLLEYHQQNKTTLVPAANLSLPSSVNVDESINSSNKEDSEVVLSLPRLTENSGISGVQDLKMPHSYGLSMLLEGFSALSLIPVVIIFLGFVTFGCFLVARKQVELTKETYNSNARTALSKRKKPRKSGKNIVEKRDEHASFDLQDKYSHTRSDNKFWLDLNQPTAAGKDGRVIGKLFVTNREIAKGSNGTIVLEGIYEGRPVAVKRLVKAYHDIAFKEIQNLIASDQHPNIVRWFGVEHDHDFVYLSLERCSCSLNDLIEMYSNFYENPFFDFDVEAMTEYRVRLGSMKNIMQDVKLWKANGYPSPLLLKLMRDVVSGLVHLHELGIIHRDLKPQNVLIIKERPLRAKLSDMGISKCLTGDMSSLGHHTTGYGSSGWQAPEQLLHGRQTRAVDLFSLGCVLFFCITGGRHPFGNRLERDINIAKNQVDLFLVEHIPEAVDLLSRLFDPNAEMRPKALEVFHHPLFWSPEMRQSFLRDTSDRVELEDRETDSDLLKALESTAPMALGGRWDEKLEHAFINNIGRYRRYKFDSVRDLLRVMRNKFNHYRELPVEIQEILGAVPEGYDGYFANRFPKLLIEVYKVINKFCREEECFYKYFKSSIV